MAFNARKCILRMCRWWGW